MNLLCIAIDEKLQLAPIIAAVIAAIIVVIGWFIVANFNRKNEIAKELRKFKLKLLVDLDTLKNSAIEYRNNKEFPQGMNEFWKLSNEVNVAVLSFCNDEIIKIYFSIELQNNILDDEKSVTKYLKDVQKCKTLLINSLRKELKLDEKDFEKLMKEQ